MPMYYVISEKTAEQGRPPPGIAARSAPLFYHVAVGGQLPKGAGADVVDRAAADFKSSLQAAAACLAPEQTSAMSAAAGLAPGTAQPGLRVALLVASACMFHARLDAAARDGALSRLGGAGGLAAPRTVGGCAHSPRSTPVGDLADAWETWQNAGYRSVFGTARAVILAAGPAGVTDEFAVRCCDAALAASRSLPAYRHDLLGRVFHRMLGESRNSGAFYTSTAAAALLAGLAIPSGIRPDLSRYRVVDPACGTGTLLMAAAARLADLHGGGAETGRALIEDVISGYDADAAAVHMAAATLAMTSPGVSFGDMGVHRVRVGLTAGAATAGSLELFDQPDKGRYREDRLPAWPASHQVDTGEDVLTARKHDLVIMNPPFTRDSLRIDHLGPEAEKAVKAREREIFARTPVYRAHSGGMFLMLGDRLCADDDGTLALVYPTASCGAPSASGVWGHLLSVFHLETAVTSHDPERIAFSENTTINETLFVLRRLNDGNRNRPTRFVNLAVNPDNAPDATRLAELLADGGQSGPWMSTLWDRGRLLAGDWTPARFYSKFLAQAAWGWFAPGGAGFAPLSDMADIGPAGNRIRDAYAKSSAPDRLGRRALWNIDTAATRTLAAAPDCFIHPKPGKQALADSYWRQRGRLLLPMRFSVPTMRLGAAVSDQDAVGSGWVPARPKPGPADPRLWEKAMCVYLNSTVGLMAAWVRWNPKTLTYPYISLEEMRRIPAPAFDDAQAADLAAVFDDQKLETQLPLSEPDGPRRMLDEAVVSVLGRVDGEVLARCRRELAREPSVTRRRASD